MSIEFTAPPAGGGGDSLTPADVEGHVLVVEPLEHVAEINTVHGPKDAIRVNVHDITAQQSYTDVLWFPGALVGTCKKAIGQKLLAVMAKGVAKPGQAPPWKLEDASKDERARVAASAYLLGQVSASLAAPAAPTPAPAAAAPSALDAALGNLAAAGLTAK
jgi:hypothetical protein